ncbi:hypothetical protein TNCT_40501 [Trichonephila clavata]|uniref:Uncharacterized protein n=1 Tax=Trichonephila clavata TaxID=2740835 RepID=A0A8X6LRB9_TRICU|nr:hypothetical protein TNCT_40501 [Trichonephila clavata]
MKHHLQRPSSEPALKHRLQPSVPPASVQPKVQLASVRSLASRQRAGMKHRLPPSVPPASQDETPVCSLASHQRASMKHPSAA